MGGNMNKKELLELVETGEGYALEFKESLSSPIGKDICAFANSSGGKIVLGVKDNGNIKGYKLSNKDRARLIDIIQSIKPNIEIKIKEIEDLVIIVVPEGKEKPYFFGNQCYIRIGASSRAVGREELREFFQRENLIQFDRKPNYEFDLKRDFDEYKFEEFRKKLKIPKELSKTHVLRNLNLLANGKINNAGVLFFCHRVTKFFMNAVVRGVLYKGKDKTYVLDKKEFDADFVSNFNNALNFILMNLKMKQEIIGRERRDVLEIPEEALREAVINAMVHRNYFINGVVQIDIFSDRVEISNPGRLLFDKRELGKISMPRNPIIFDLAYRLGYVEKIGSGIQRIKHLVPNVKFEISSNWFRVVFKREELVERPIKRKDIISLIKKEKIERKDLLEMLENRVGRKLVERVGRKLVENSLKIILIILEKPEVSKRELSEILGISDTAVDKHIKKLKDLKVIERVGPAKGGYWKVLK